MALRLEELSKTIDQTLPDPELAPEELAALCRRARDVHVASVCVPAAQVRTAADELHGSDVKTCALIGFPSGRAGTQVKLDQARQALADGAGELELVLNTAALRAGDARLVRDELVALARLVRLGSANGGRGTVSLKAVVGTASLDDPLKKLAAKIAELAEVDFVQTGTGYGGDEATVHDVELLRECLPESVGVKASGGIRTLDDVLTVINAGAGRVGSAAALDILEPATPLVGTR
jgi:deoxyribose-phosphate aldolase